MVFKKKEITELKPDCIDFKPKLFDKKHCKLTHKCDNAGGKYRIDYFVRFSNFCTGISEGMIVRHLIKKYK